MPSSAKWGVHINAKYAMYRLLHMLHIKLHISAYFHCIFIAYLTNTVYIFAYFLHFWLYLHIKYAICRQYTFFLNYSIFFAYLCIFLLDPFQLAGLLSVPVPFQQALPLHVCVHPSAHADSPWFTSGRRLLAPWPAPTRARLRPALPAAAAAPSTPSAAAACISLALAAGQSLCNTC